MSTRTPACTLPPTSHPCDEPTVVSWQWSPTTDQLFMGGLVELPFANDRPRFDRGRSLLRRILRADVRRHAQRMQQLLIGKRSTFSCDTRVRTPKGILVLHLSASALRGADRQVIHVYGSATLRKPDQPNSQEAAPLELPHSDQASLERSWLAGISALESHDNAQSRWRREQAANRVGSRLLAHVTHELKNAINAVGGYGEMIEASANAADQPKIAQWAASIARARDHARELIDDVLEACRIEAGQAPAEISEFDVLPVVEEVLAISQPIAAHYKNTVHLEIAANIGSMRSDKVKLRQILINLMSNAAKFTQEGRITLSAQRHSDDQIWFDVTDTGVGMSATQIERLFQPFSQVGEKVDSRGSGLGLHITRSLCRLVGGVISVDSSPGEGSRFRVALPADATLDHTTIVDGSRPELVIGAVGGLSTLDPQVALMRSTWQFMSHIFEGLTQFDDKGRIVPSLATRWFAVDATTWLFELRTGVRFHDGTEFSGEDVLATFTRLLQRRMKDPSIGTIVSDFEEYRLLAPHKLLIRSKSPWPTLPAEISEILIINRRFAAAAPDEFDTMKAVVGTGPYRLLSGRPNAQLRCEAFADHWKGMPAWRSILLCFIPDESHLVDGFAAGQFDVIDNLHPHGQHHIRDLPDVEVVSCPGSGLYYLALNTNIEANSCVTDHGGTPLATNPLHDIRVRKAMSLAIDRSFLCNKVMMGNAKPAGDVVLSTLDGSNPANRPDRYDATKARELLTDAGYPNGFRLTLTSPDDMAFLPLTRAISLMLSSVGIETRYHALDRATFFDNHFRGNSAADLIAWYDTTGEASYTLRNTLGTMNPDRRVDGGDMRRYRNADFYSVLRAALITGDQQDRITLLQRACAVAAADLPVIPLVEPSACWAVRKEYRVRTNVLGMTWAWFVERTSDPEDSGPLVSGQRPAEIGHQIVGMLDSH